MEIRTEQRDGEVWFDLAGRFDAHEVGTFKGLFDDLLGQGISHFRIDLADVNFVDSTGLAAMVRGMKRARERGGDVVLVRPSDPVRVILELTCLDVAFVIVDDAPADSTESQAPDAATSHA